MRPMYVRYQTLLPTAVCVGTNSSRNGKGSGHTIGLAAHILSDEIGGALAQDGWAHRIQRAYSEQPSLAKASNVVQCSQ